MNKKYHVKLNELERKAILEEMEKSETPKTIRKRSNILLQVDETLGKPATQEEISKRCGVSDVTVYQTVKDYDTQGLTYVLRRREHEQPPRKRIVTGEKEARIVALACGEAPNGYAKWSIRLLRDKVVELQIVDAICPETIRTTLKKRNLSLT